MIEKAIIIELAEENLQNTNKYVVDIQVKSGNIITVVIDGDVPVTIVDCIHLSKFIESKFDRETEDFDLKVSSFGAEKPFLLKRQYHKNIGRELEIITDEDKILRGKLLEADDKRIKIKLAERKKKDQALSEEMLIDFDHIKQAKCIISFK